MGLYERLCNASYMHNMSDMLKWCDEFLASVYSKPTDGWTCLHAVTLKCLAAGSTSWLAAMIISYGKRQTAYARALVGLYLRSTWFKVVKYCKSCDYIRAYILVESSAIYRVPVKFTVLRRLSSVAFYSTAFSHQPVNSRCDPKYIGLVARAVLSACTWPSCTLRLCRPAKPCVVDVRSRQTWLLDNCVGGQHEGSVNGGYTGDEWACSCRRKVWHRLSHR
jgi:hypothetical protein